MITKANEKNLIRVNLRVHSGRASIQQKEARQFVSAHFGCDYKNISTSIRLISKKWTNDIKKAVNSLSGKYYYLTFDWGDSGWRAITPANFLELEKLVRDTSSFVHDELQNIRMHWAEVTDDSKQIMGNFFIPELFNDPDTILGGYDIQLLHEPMPQQVSTDILVDIFGEEKANQLQSEQDVAASQAYSAVTSQYINKLVDKLDTLIERTGEDQHKKHYKICLEKLDELSSPDFRVTDDAAVSSLCNDIQKQLTKIDPDQIRSNDFVRKHVTDSANSLRDRLLSISL